MNLVGKSTTDGARFVHTAAAAGAGFNGITVVQTHVASILSNGRVAKLLHIGRAEMQTRNVFEISTPGGGFGVAK